MGHNTVSDVLSGHPHQTFSEGAVRVQLVGELLLELLVRGSNPLGVGLLLESVVRGWNLTCPIRVHLSVDTGTHTAKEVCILIVQQKPSDPHGTGHPGLCLTSSIG